jgi:cyclase
MNNDFQSKHFTLVKVKDGIYAAIANEGGGAMANAGFIDLGDKTVVFDTFNTQQAAEDLKNAAEQFTNRPVTWVVNSHWHGDHIRGNQVFTGSSIISSEKTYFMLKENTPSRIEKQKNDMDGLEKYIQTLIDKDDPALKGEISFLKELALSLPTLRLVLPQYTFQEQFTFHGSKRSAQLIKFGRAHSPCDSVLYIPDDGVIFMADLLFVNTHPPFFEEGDVGNWRQSLEKIMEMDFVTAVPGHGPVGTKDDLETIVQYMDKMAALAGSENIEHIEVPAAYKEWNYTNYFYQNIKELRKLIGDKNSSKSK